MIEMHVKHVCPSENADEQTITLNGGVERVKALIAQQIESLKMNYEWPHDDMIPLNIDESQSFGRRRGPKLHNKCPYCGALTEGMDPCTGREVALLSAGPRRYLKGEPNQ